MTPLPLRRFRAERLLRRDFDGLRTNVLRSVRSRLDCSGGGLDMADLDACYAQAWHGLYTAMLDGVEIDNPAGWLVVVTLRRAIEERRSRHNSARAPAVELEDQGSEPDIAGHIDDLSRLRQLFEGLRERLSAREREAATLCYLQGLPRAQAAERMGVSDQRMRKLMEGNGAGHTGVAAKVGELLAVIRADGWCEQRGSTMRALALGILDPNGERHQLAMAHQRECPSCRRYVLSLRGLAAILPPLLPPGWLGLGAGAGAGAGVGAGAAGGATTGIGAGAGAGAAAGAGGTAGAASGVAAGGASWWPLAGSASAKLAGGLAALGLAAGGAALVTSPRRPVHALRARTDSVQAHVLSVDGEAALLGSNQHSLDVGVPSANARNSFSDNAQPRPHSQAARSAERLNGRAAANAAEAGSDPPSEFGIEAAAPPTPSHSGSTAVDASSGGETSANPSTSQASQTGSGGEEFSFE